MAVPRDSPQPRGFSQLVDLTNTLAVDSRNTAGVNIPSHTEPQSGKKLSPDQYTPFCHRRAPRSFQNAVVTCRATPVPLRAISTSTPLDWLRRSFLKARFAPVRISVEHYTPPKIFPAARGRTPRPPGGGVQLRLRTRSVRPDGETCSPSLAPSPLIQAPYLASSFSHSDRHRFCTFLVRGDIASRQFSIKRYVTQTLRPAQKGRLPEGPSRD